MTTMANDADNMKKCRGRPKVFDREDALDKAMALFWQHGYEATSMAHLVEATGAKAPTLYAEFANKEGLFLAVLDHYIKRFADNYAACLVNDDKPLEQVLENYLLSIAKCFTSQGKSPGCFFVSTSSVLAASSQKIADGIKTRHAKQRETLVSFLKQRQKKGEIPAQSDIHALTNYLACIIQGMSVSARENASFQELEVIVRTTLRMWSELVHSTTAQQLTEPVN